MSDNVDLLVGRFQHLPMANEEPAHPLASYYCDECGEPDWTDTHQGGDIREFYADEERGDTICEPCARLRAANAEGESRAASARTLHPFVGHSESGGGRE